MRWGIVIASLCASVQLAGAATYEVSSATELFSRLSMATAGDEIIVHAGTYTTPGSGYLNYTWAGSAAMPIVIRAADGEHPIIEGNRNQNVINISGSYFTFKGFEIRGGSHGLRLQAVDHATLEDLVVHDLGDVGISCNLAPNNCSALTIRHCEIYDTGKDGGTGEGMYLGCNDGSCTLTDSLVERNYVHDMGGSQGDGIEIKTGSSGNAVRDNVIVRSKYPGITMYGFAGSGGFNVVERNLVWHVTVDAGIQVVGQVIVRNNIVIDTVSYGIFSKPSNAIEPHDVTIVNNTVVGASACLRTTNWTGQTGQLVANNALYCGATAAIDVGTGAAGATFANNIGLGTNNAPSGFTAGTSLAADLGDPTSSVYPPAGSALINAGAAATAATDDFNTSPRVDGMPDVGAYERNDAVNPGWPLGEDFKSPSAVVIDGPNDRSDGGPGGNDTPGSDSGCCSTTSRPRDALFGLAVFALVLRRRRRVRS